MKLIQANPDQHFFVWQYMIQAANFAEFGLDVDMVILVGLRKGVKPSQEILEFEKTFRGEIHYYEDTRVSSAYIPSIRPHLIKKYLKDHPQKVFFFHDPDIIFLKNPNLSRFENDSFHYVAKTVQGYCYSKYLKGFPVDLKDAPREKYLYKAICDSIGISTTLYEENDDNCGGAQYIIRGTGYNFWDKHERDCENQYKMLKKHTDEEDRNGIYRIQIWACDLWVLFANLLLTGVPVRHLHEIDFSWPHVQTKVAEEENIYILHNAGINESNRAENGKLRYFDKGLYNDLHGNRRFPFDDDFSYVSPDILQYKYISYFNQFKTKPMERKILAIWNSVYGRPVRKPHIGMLEASLKALKKAADKSKIPIKVITTSWEPIPDNPFEEIISNQRGKGHLNYIEQMEQQLERYPEGYDFVVIVEHDTLIPEDYFNEVYENWDYTKYGLSNRNYIGLNKTGYLDVVERHHPLSTMSFATFFFKALLQEKKLECAKNVAPGSPYGWCCIEPDDKSLLSEFWSKEPMIHISTEGWGEYECHTTSHNTVCYQRTSDGKESHPYWKHFTEALPVVKNFI
ncbi:MAG: hypothetical protein E6Q36_08180 [Chryseobacterium sp.]|nr:MAG: hypothetical protein E6Q36_08180 [Chryseobacterium sp.]